MTLKTLLIFAHYGEAQSFFESPIPNTEILICGEGLTNCLYKTTEHLAIEAGKYKIVVNLGIVGSLDSKMKMGDIHSIKTVYAEDEFKSFRLDDETAQIDLISASTRVKSKEKKENLSHYAQLVDRELWAIGYACSKKGLKLVSYKLISDEANDSLQCEKIIEDSKNFSKKLYDYFLSKHSILETKLQNTFPEIPKEWEKFFHFSHTQRKKLENLLERLSLLGLRNSLNEELIENCKHASPLPKERTNYLLKKLSHQLNPDMAKVEEKLEKLISPITKVGARINFSPDFEEDYFTLSMKIENEKNLKRLKESLDQINYKSIIDVLNGSPDV